MAEACLQRVFYVIGGPDKRKGSKLSRHVAARAACALRFEPALMLNPTAEAQNINPLACARPPSGSARRAGHNIQELRILASKITFAKNCPSPSMCSELSNFAVSKPGDSLPKICKNAVILRSRSDGRSPTVLPL